MDLTKLSRFMSFVLRHDPGSIGLELDSAGWASISDIVRLGQDKKRKFDRSDVLSVVETDEKKRYSLSSDGKKIRAAQGHSFPIDLGLVPKAPPDTLFHGTSTKNLDSIMRDGILPMSRDKVHLSLDRETAITVGKRHGNPAVLVVDSGSMHENGHVFLMADNGVWLADSVPFNFIKIEYQEII